MALDAARKIVLEKGLSGLTTRGIAKEIGYTVGSLYQVFDNVDQLIEQLNIETIDHVRSMCDQLDLDDDAADSLRKLSHLYIHFTQENPQLWDAVIDHKLPTGYRRQDAYFDSVGKLVGVVEKAIASFFKADELASRNLDANLLWASLYGITALATAGRLARHETTLSLIDRLIETYIAAKTHDELTSKSDR